MKTLYPLLLIALTFSLSCTKENEDERELRKLRKNCDKEYVQEWSFPEGRSDVFIIDDSLNISFNKDYGILATANQPSSSQSAFGHLQPSKGVQVYRKEDGSAFHFSGDNIRIDADPARNNSWWKWGTTLMSKSGCYSLYEEKWTLASSSETFYIVFRTEILQHMGWLKLSADPDSGEIKLLDYFLTTEQSVSLP